MAQLRVGAKAYVDNFNRANTVADAINHQSPFLSCFCDDCIARGIDINRGGAKYPTAHGACGMGIATVADSLAAIETLVYRDKLLTLGQLRDVLAANFEGYEDLQKKRIAVPKYGNNDDIADKYAIWFVEAQADLFDSYRTPDGGRYYIAIASNTQNIGAGREIGATPDGRGAGLPVSDAASPMRGMDRSGPTASALSLCKPDYTRVACGTVVNQKYTPDMFQNAEKRAKLGAVIRSYFLMGGQELQINCVSKDTLRDAQAHPGDYESLVVRVSGFSAYYTKLDRSVQEDILARTEHY
jgi:formate C-acetyltransferase